MEYLDLMINRPHHPKKTHKQTILEKINEAEERMVNAEVARIKRTHIEKFGHPKPISKIPIKGIVSESDETVR
jgi:hypothetical protein